MLAGLVATFGVAAVCPAPTMRQNASGAVVPAIHIGFFEEETRGHWY